MIVEQCTELTSEIIDFMGSRVFCGDEEILKDEIKNRVSVLLEFCNTQNLFYVILRNEEKELVVCCLSGQGPDTKKVTDYIFRTASKNGKEKIRFHTQREGLAKLLKKYRPKLKSAIYEIKVT